MPKQDTLRPVDVALVLALAVKRDEPAPTYSELGHTLGVSSSTTFESVQRLQGSGLLRPETREPNTNALMNFLEHGVRCAFPPALGQEVRGIPTAHAGPALSEFFDPVNPFVWPDADGPARGTALAPLYPKATDLPAREPEIYNVLTLVDALRVGQARERAVALDELKRCLRGKAKMATVRP